MKLQMAPGYLPDPRTPTQGWDELRRFCQEGGFQPEDALKILRQHQVREAREHERQASLFQPPPNLW